MEVSDSPEPSTACDDTVEETDSNAFPTEHIPKKMQVKTKKKKDETSSASAVLMKYIVDNNQKTTTEAKHPIDAFLEGIAPTIKNLSPYLQHVAKGKIFSIVQELERQALLSQQTASGCSASYPRTMETQEFEGSCDGNTYTILP